MIFSGIAWLGTALVIMAQWFLWIILSSAIWHPWSMILGIGILAWQMLLMFNETKENESCALPGAG